MVLRNTKAPLSLEHCPILLEQCIKNLRELLFVNAGSAIWLINRLLYGMKNHEKNLQRTHRGSMINSIVNLRGRIAS